MYTYRTRSKQSHAMSNLCALNSLRTFSRTNISKPFCWSRAIVTTKLLKAVVSYILCIAYWVSTSCVQLVAQILSRPPSIVLKAFVPIVFIVTVYHSCNTKQVSSTYGSTTFSERFVRRIRNILISYFLRA